MRGEERVCFGELGLEFGVEEGELRGGEGGYVCWLRHGGESLGGWCAMCDMQI